MANIEMDFANAKRQAAELEQLAHQLEQLAGRQFHGTMQDLSLHWKGENATAYLQKGVKLQEDMKTTAARMRAAAVQIRRVAKKIYDAEMFAKRLAEKRIYGGNGD